MRERVSNHQVFFNKNSGNQPGNKEIELKCLFCLFQAPWETFAGDWKKIPKELAKHITSVVYSGGSGRSCTW
jgi:hypothetical protein